MSPMELNRTTKIWVEDFTRTKVIECKGVLLNGGIK